MCLAMRMPNKERRTGRHTKQRRGGRDLPGDAVAIVIPNKKKRRSNGPVIRWSEEARRAMGEFPGRTTR